MSTSTKDGLPEGREGKLSPEEIEYKKKLRDALLSVTDEFLRDHRSEIIRRAEERLKFEESLRE